MANVEVRIKLQDNGLADIDELNLRYRLQDEIEDRGIGHVLGSGSGFGEMDIDVEVADVPAATTRLRQLAEEYQIANITDIREFRDSSS